MRHLLLRARHGLHFTGKTRDAVVATMCRMPGNKGFASLLALLNIFKLLNQSKEVRVLSSRGFSPLLDEFASKRINRADKFIFENFAAPRKIPTAITFSSRFFSSPLLSWPAIHPTPAGFRL